MMNPIGAAPVERRTCAENMADRYKKSSSADFSGQRGCPRSQLTQAELTPSTTESVVAAGFFLWIPRPAGRRVLSGCVGVLEEAHPACSYPEATGRCCPRHLAATV